MNMNVLQFLILRAIIEKPYKCQPQILGGEILFVNSRLNMKLCICCVF